MTPGWRRWTAILTTYICLFAGAITYRIRVPPPGQLVALSGDDLRVELDLPPPGRGNGGGGLLAPGGTPDSRSRRQEDAGGVEDASGAAIGGGGRVRRDGELWIELVDMEMGAEKARRRKDAEERWRWLEEGGGVKAGSGAKGGGRGRRWRREEDGGGGGSGEGRETMDRREIGGGWNSVEGEKEEEKAEGKQEPADKNKEPKRYGWVAGGVRPKGEKENALRVSGKEAGGTAGGAKGAGAEGAGKWAGGDRWGGKLRWRSWNGRVGGVGGGNTVKMTEEAGKGGALEGAREKKGGGWAEDAGRGQQAHGGGEANGEKVGRLGAKDKEGESDEEEGEGEGEEVARGLILETALVSRGWHFPSATPKGSPHPGPSPPHSTLALTFPASHFTHGGLYVVRLVGTGRVVSNPGTQRPQRDTATTEGAVESKEMESQMDTRKGDLDHPHAAAKDDVTNGTRGAKADNAPKVGDQGLGSNKSEVIGPKGGLASDGKDRVVGRLEGTGKTAIDLAPSTRSDDVHKVSEVVRKEGDDRESVKRMYGRILEALENREEWEEYDRGAVPSDRKSPGEMDESGKLTGQSGRRAGRRKRETDSSGSRQKATEEPLLRRGDHRVGGGVLSEVDGGTSGELRGMKWPEWELSAVSDYGEGFDGERHTAGQWLDGGIGGRVVSKSWDGREERFLEGGDIGRWREGKRPLEDLATRREEDGLEEVSETETRASPSSFLRAYLEDKASAGVEKRKRDASGGDEGEDGGVSSVSEDRDTSTSSGLAGPNRVARSKSRRRNEEGSIFEEQVIDRLSERPKMENDDITDVNSGALGSSRIQKRDAETPNEEDGIENSDVKGLLGSIRSSTTEEVPGITTTTEGRVSREVGKGCKENCESTTSSRHILAEENVLVSWPAARFTLNILSSSSSFSSSASKPKAEPPPRNLTFETFEAPVRVLVEIPCGIDGVGRKVRREVAGEELRKTLYAIENRDTGKVSVRIRREDNERTVNGTEDGVNAGKLRVISSAMQKNQNEEKDGSWIKAKEITGAESSREGEKPKRTKKGARGEMERLWNDWWRRGEGGSRRERRDLKGEQNHFAYPPRWGSGLYAGGDSVLSSLTTERQLAVDGEEEEEAPPLSEEAKSARGVVMRIRKERVTKYDINDDALESLEEKAGVLGSSGYAMKREAPGGPQGSSEAVSGRGKRSLGGLGKSGKRLRVETWLKGNVGEGPRRGGDGEEDQESLPQERYRRVKRAPTTAGSSRNPKTGLSPGPPKLPFRVFLVLRYCGVDSTECDEEDSGKEDMEIWRRPQTVFTKELVDFPVCPKYQHQVILPCDAFGQAGVYMVQVRSNYTMEMEEDEVIKVEKGRKKRGAEEVGRGGEQEVRARHQILTNPSDGTIVVGSNLNRKHKGAETMPVINKASDKVRVKGRTRNSKNSEQSGANNKQTISKRSAGDPDETHAFESSKGRHEGTRENRHGYEEVLGETFGGGTGVFETVSEEDGEGGVGEGPPLSRKPRGSAWEMGGSSWWEFGSGDGDSDDGSGDWGDGGWPDAGRGRREGSGDAEYGDDPDGGSGGDSNASSRRRLPDPPPGSLWSSSQSITVRLSQGYVFTVHARSVFPCSDAHVRPDTLEPAPSGVPVLFEYPECILDASDRIRVFGRARPDVAAILPPFWMGTDASTDAAVTLSHPSLRYVAEKKIYKGKHNAWFDCSLFTERYSEYCFAYASEAMTGAVTHVRAQCIPTLPTSDKDRGGWGSWSAWSQCSTTCGSGSRNRYRTCDNPPPRYGAPFCEGPALETQICPPPAGVTYEELQEMCPLGLALNAADDANRKGSEPNCRCGGCVVHLQGVAGSWTSRNAGPIKPRARLIASSSQACPGRSFWLLQAEPGHVVGLTVSSLLLPCPRRQWLKARDGDSLSSRLVLHLPSSASSASGAPAYSTEALCFSSGPHLLLEFYSFERLDATCNGGFLAHAHQVLANSSASAIGRDVLLTPTTRAVPRSSLSVHAVALAFILALLALSGGLALNYILRRRRFNEELKKREKEEEEMSDSDSDTKCFIARNRDGGSATSVTSVSDVISLRKLSVGKDSKRREVHMRLTEESDEDDEDEEDEDEEDEGGRRRAEGATGKEEGGATQSTDHNEPAKANLPRVEVLPLKGKRGGGRRSRRRARVETAARGGVRGVVVEEEEEEEEKQEQEEQEGERGSGGGEGGDEEGDGAEGAPEVVRRRRRKAGGSAGRREWRESACPLLEPETSVAQSSISLPSSPTEVLGDDPAVTPNAPGRPGLSASAPLLLRRSLSFFAATASASSAVAAAGDSPPEGGVAQSISAAGKQWWRKKMQRFQNGSVSPVREELEETWRLAEPHSPKKKDAASGGKGKKRAPGDAVPPAKECKEKQNRERLLRAGGASPVVPGVHHSNPPSSTASDSPSATTSPELSRPGSNGGGGRLRGRLLRATRTADERGKCTSEASLAGGASELDLEFDYYDYNVQNAGAAPGSYLGMDPAFLVYIPPFEGSTSPSSNASSASTLQAPPSEGGTDALLSASSSPQPPKGASGHHRGDYYCINASYARANFQELNGGRNVAGVSDGEMMSMAEFGRSSVEDEEEEESEEGRGSEKETRVEKSPVEDVEDLEEDEIKFADDDDDEEEEEDSERAKMEGKYGVITAEGVGLKKPV